MPVARAICCNWVDFRDESQFRLWFECGCGYDFVRVSDSDRFGVARMI